MIVNEGLVRIRDEILNVVEDVAIGTGGSGTTSDMNELENEIIRKTSDDVEGQAIGESLHRIRLTSGEANNETLRECGVIDQDGNLISRNVHAPLEKNETFEVVYEISIEIKNME